MPRTAEQNEIIREATRSAILDSAMVAFAQKGYATTTIRDIAEQAGISTGLMYHYFDGKEGLLLAVFDTCMTILGEAFAEAIDQSEPGQRLSALLRAMFALLESDREFWGLFYMMRSQPAIMIVLGDSFRLWTARLRELFIGEFKDAGREDPVLDALILYSLIEGTFQQYLLDPANYPLEVVAVRIIEEFGVTR